MGTVTSSATYDHIVAILPAQGDLRLREIRKQGVILLQDTLFLKSRALQVSLCTVAASAASFQNKPSLL